MGLTRSAPLSWRLTFVMDDPSIMEVVKVARGDSAAVIKATALFKRAVRAAMAAGGCRSVVIGVHVEGAECDHEVGP